MRRRRSDYEFGRPARILFGSLAQKTELEALNVIRQSRYALELIEQWGGTLQLTGDVIREFHRLTIDRIYGCAGEYRNAFVSIDESRHVPPPWQKVPALVDEMCAYANALRSYDNATHIAAFLLWRIAWIHPFHGGNGRVARAVSYLALCTGLNMILPGEHVLPELLDREQDRCCAALADADRAWAASDQTIDASDAAAVQRITSKVQSLVNELLAEQLAGAL